MTSNTNIVGINGSPDPKGNCSILLNEALRVCEDAGCSVEIIVCSHALKGQNTPFCINCQRPCQAKCALGKPLEEALKSLRRADGLIIGSPVYFGNVSGQLKAFWDKTRSLRTSKSLLNVVGGALVVGGSQYGGQEYTAQSIHHMMMVQGMIIVGDGHHEDDCGHFGALGRRPATEDVSAQERAMILARRVVEVARATRAARLDGR